MTITRIGVADAVPEESDAEYTCTFHDAGPAAEALDADAILTIDATLSDVTTGEIINAREDQDVLGANGGSITAPGVFTLRLTGNVDNVIVTPSSSSLEKHRLTLKVSYNKTGGGTGYLNHEVHFYVLRLHDVPVAS